MASSGIFCDVKLNGTNYCIWKNMMIAHLCELNKMRYVNRSIYAPTKDSDEFPKWETINGSVKSVLYNAMTEDVVQLITNYDIASEIWATLRDLYLHEFDLVQRKILFSKVQVYPGLTKSKVVCSHCNYLGHTKDKCYKLIDYLIEYFDKPITSTHHHTTAIMIDQGKIGMILQISSFISADT